MQNETSIEGLKWPNADGFDGFPYAWELVLLFAHTAVGIIFRDQTTPLL